jgi:quinol monooxygenase YgiN
MIMIEGWIRMDAADIERMRPAAVAMIEATRKEDGCLEYAFAHDLSDPCLFRIVERWRDEAALAAHFQTPHMAVFGQALGTANRQGGSVKLYKAEFERNLIGD